MYSLDLRGRGKSDGERFYVAKFSDYTDDIDTLMKHVKSQEPGLPVFLLLNVVGKETVMVDIQTWIDAHLR